MLEDNHNKLNEGADEHRTFIDSYTVENYEQQKIFGSEFKLVLHYKFIKWSSTGKQKDRVKILVYWGPYI